jgi:hypothetical protein
MTRSSDECSACPLLLDVLSELHKSPRFFIELGLHLVELLELCALTPHRDSDHSYLPRDLNARRTRRGVIVFWHAEVVVFVVIPLIDVKALASWVMTVTPQVSISRYVGRLILISDAQ